MAKRFHCDGFSALKEYRELFQMGRKVAWINAANRLVYGTIDDVPYANETGVRVAIVSIAWTRAEPQCCRVAVLD